MTARVLSLAAYKCDEVQRHQLMSVPMPPETDTYCPIPHNYLLDVAEDCMAEIGFQFGPQHHGLSHDGARYFGVVELLGGSDNPDFKMVMGLRNSLDKRFRAGIAFGAHVMVCANLCFGGEVTVGHKHTVNITINLPNLIYAAIGNVKSLKANQERRFEVYRDHRLTDRDAADIIVNRWMRDVQAINTSRIEKVVQEWHEPSYDHGPKTAWRLFNAATEALKGCNIQEMPQRTIGLQAVLDQVCEFTPLAAAA